MEKITLEEYKQKYSSFNPLPIKKAKSLVNILLFGIGLVIVVCLYLLVLKSFELNEYVGYGSIGLSVILFIVFYIVPLAKIHKKPKFELNVKESNLKDAKKHNQKVRAQLSKNIISLYEETSDINWFKQENIDLLKLAISTNDEIAQKEYLDKVYKEDIVSTSKKIIMKYAKSAALVTAVSNSNYVDTIYIAYSQLSMIKDIIYLYGFRPSEEQIIKIYRKVLMNALVAYGANQSAQGLGKSVGKKLSEEVFKSIPVLGNAIGSTVGGLINGGTNFFMTVILGNVTKKVLINEFNLQYIIDGIEEIEENEQVKMIAQAKKQAEKVEKTIVKDIEELSNESTNESNEQPTQPEQSDQPEVE